MFLLKLYVFVVGFGSIMYMVHTHGPGAFVATLLFGSAMYVTAFLEKRNARSDG